MLRLLLDCFGLFALRLFFILLGLLSFGGGGPADPFVEGRPLLGVMRPTRDLGCFAWDVDEGPALMHHTWRQRMLFLALCNLVPANLFIDELSPMSIHRVRTEFAAQELPTHCGNVGAQWHWRMALGLRNYRVKIGLMIRRLRSTSGCKRLASR